MRTILSPRSTSSAFVRFAAVATLAVAGCGDGKSLSDHLAESPTGSSATGDVMGAAADDSAYRAQIGQAQEQRLGDQRSEFFSEHGADKSVEVVITGIAGDPAAAGIYLRKKLFKAAYHDYSEASTQAKQQTEANRKAAADAAVAEHRKTWGEMYGPTFIHFQYRPVESSLSYPEIESGPSGGGTFTFYASPVLDLNEFAKRFNVGQVTDVDKSARRVTLRSSLPDPIPDFDVEELIVRHGLDNVATLVVTNAAGDERAVGAYLGRQAGQLDPRINLYVVGPKPIRRDTYKMTIAPVGDLVALSERINFGRVASLDPSKRSLTIEAQLPDPLPTAVLAGTGTGAAGEIKKLSDWSDFDKEPLPGESKIDWALRIIKGRGLYVSRALVELATMPVDPAELPRVSEVLIATFEGSGLNLDRHLDALVTWKTPEGGRKIADKITEDWGGHYTEKYIAAIERMDLPEATDAAAEAIRRRITSDRASFRLDDHLNALERLGRPDVAVDALKMLVQREAASFGHREAIRGLTRFKTPEAAEVVASQLGHRFVGDDASAALRQMGPAAEPIAIRLLMHRAPLVRAEGANILYEVGSEKAIEALSAAISREKEAAVKSHLRDVRKQLVLKLKASEQET